MGAPAIPALTQALHSENRDVESRAASALGKIGLKAIPALLTGVAAGVAAADDVSVNIALSALHQLGPGRIPILIAVVSDTSEDGVIRCAAIEALGDCSFAGASESAIAPVLSALIVALTDSNVRVRYLAAKALGDIGPQAGPAGSALAVTLSDEDVDVGGRASWALLKTGRPALPALVMRLVREKKLFGVPTELERCLGSIGDDLKKQGTILWWVVPSVYWKEITGLVLLLSGWFALMARVPKQRPSSPRELALLAVTAAVPTVLCGLAVLQGSTRDWAQGFMPDALTLVPLPVAAVLSMALVHVLLAVWVRQRKSGATEESTGSESEMAEQTPR